MFESINDLAGSIIEMLQRHIDSLGFTPVIHFELEGCYHSEQANKRLDFQQVNHLLQQLNIEGRLIPEYWHRQWEYVSLFNGQLPLSEAQYLARAIEHLPKLFAQQGITTTLIKPVVWAGDKGKLADGCKNIFSGEERAVHIPNAIQMNVSVNNSAGENIISQAHFGEYLQQCFIDTSLSCCLLYLPEVEAFDRFELKTKYGLNEELCSPNDISGGHQGSVALYKQYGKHNQQLGETPLVYDHQDRVIASEHLWQKTARIEHRLGASSIFYNPYVNVIYGLLNIIDALNVYIKGQCHALLMPLAQPLSLPSALYGDEQQLGAVELFNEDTWFAERIDQLEQEIFGNSLPVTTRIGTRLKAMILANYQQPAIIMQ